MFFYLQNWGSDFSCVNLSPSDTVPTSGETVYQRPCVNAFDVLFYL